MAIGYRAIFRLSDTEDAVSVADEQLRSWFESKRRSGVITTSEWSGPGLHQLGPRASLRVSQLFDERDGSRRQVARFVEANSGGEWEVSVIAVSLQQARAHHQTLVVEVALRNADLEESMRRVASPRLVSQLLERVEVWDGQTRLTATPRAINTRTIDEVIEAITDDERTASVIVASSPDAALDAKWYEIVESLTKQSIGDAAIFVVDGNVVDDLNSRLPASHAVMAGRVRTFLPHVELEIPADALRHRVLGPATLTRSITKGKVRGLLPWIHAAGPRQRFLQQELPTDVRRSLELLSREEARTARATRIEQQVSRPASPTSPPIVRPAIDIRTTAIAGTLFDRLRVLLRTWTGSESPDETSLDQLELTLVESQVEAKVAVEQLDEVLAEHDATEAELRELRTQLDDIEVEAAIQAQEASEARREVFILRSRLVAVGASVKTYVEPEHEDWLAPESVQELITRITVGKKPHVASRFVVWTGEEAPALEVQKRDQVGRYASAFWEYIHVLHDYAKLKAEGIFSGSLYQYLTADGQHSGYICSVARYAATESETVLNQWGTERIFRVPSTVDASEKVQMLAHFRPTNENTFAPRLYFLDDTSGTGKIYVGYIGRHLTNSKTSDS